MQITRIEQASRYDAPKHFDMRALRLQGFDASDARFAWVGLSHFLPGGGAAMDSSPLAKIYVVLAGSITVELHDGTRHVLQELDSCYLAPSEARAVHNESNRVATMLVVMPYPEATP